MILKGKKALNELEKVGFNLHNFTSENINLKTLTINIINNNVYVICKYRDFKDGVYKEFYYNFVLKDNVWTNETISEYEHIKTLTTKKRLELLNF
ncbi:MAG: hypothetical protein ACRC6E_06765 [Fusobacteriaceae bacterium]